MRLGYHASNRWRNRDGTPWVFGTRISETILASVHVRARKKAEHLDAEAREIPAAVSGHQGRNHHRLRAQIKRDEDVGKRDQPPWVSGGGHELPDCLDAATLELH